MEGEDILTHIDTMANYYERLNSLVSKDKPLTADDVHSAALLSSIPQDWLHCVSSLMNQDGVKTTTIINALKNEHTRRQSHTEVVASVSSAKLNQRPSNKSTPSAKNPTLRLLQR